MSWQAHGNMEQHLLTFKFTLPWLILMKRLMSFIMYVFRLLNIDSNGEWSSCFQQKICNISETGQDTTKLSH